MSSTTGLPTIKRAKLSGPLIGTHNGHFHADEALAVFLLRLLPTYADSPLARTRDPSVLATCHTVVDVGGAYDVSRNRFDHHQREFAATFPGRSTKLSSAGLVYMHFGKAIVSQQTGLDISSEDVEALYQKLYDGFIEGFDANDNGVSAYDTRALQAAGIQKRFEDRGFSIASVVSRYNSEHVSLPSPAAPATGDAGDAGAEAALDQAREDARFQKASDFTGEQFLLELKEKHLSWLPARALIKDAYANRSEWDAKGRIMVLPYRKEGLPWHDHLYALEEAASSGSAAPGMEVQVLYVLFPESDAADSKWRIRAVSVQGGGFQNRKDLPDAWKGVRDDELDKISGIPGCVFVHASGFIGGNKTFAGVLQMAQKAVDM